MITIKKYLSGLILGTAGLALLITLTIAPAQDDDQVALIFPPWVGEQEALRKTAALGLPIIRWGASHHTVILDVRANGPHESRLRDVGWLVVAANVASNCFFLAPADQDGKEILS